MIIWIIHNSKLKAFQDYSQFRIIQDDVNQRVQSSRAHHSYDDLDYSQFRIIWDDLNQRVQSSKAYNFQDYLQFRIAQDDLNQALHAWWWFIMLIKTRLSNTTTIHNFIPCMFNKVHFSRRNSEIQILIRIFQVLFSWRHSRGFQNGALCVTLGNMKFWLALLFIATITITINVFNIITINSNKTLQRLSPSKTCKNSITPIISRSNIF